MKISLRTVLLAALSALAVCSASAQVVDLVTVEKLTEYVQTSAGAPSLAASLPYRFDITASSLTDQEVGGIAAPTVTLAAGSQAPTNLATAHNGGVLIDNDDEWRYGGQGVGLNVLANLNGLFTNGPNNYTVTAEGHTYSLSLGGPAGQAFFPGFIPTVTMTGGSWVGGKYVIDVSQVLTITTNSFDLFHTTGIGAIIDLELDEADSEVVFSRIAPDSFASSIEANTGITTATLTIAANTLTAGMDYDGSAAFNRIVSQDASQSGVFAAAWWGNETSFTVSAVSAIPEPSTYAALAGLGALGLVAWQRRRRQLTA